GLGATNRQGVDLSLSQEIRADCIDMSAFGNPMAVEHRLTTGSCRDNNVFFLCGHFGTRDRLDDGSASRAHFLGKTPAPLQGRAINLNTIDSANPANCQ